MEQISVRNEAQTDSRAASRLEALTEEATRLQTEQTTLSVRWEVAEPGKKDRWT